MKIKGNILLSRLAFVRERFGEQALEKVVSSLPEEDQTILRGMVSNVGWYAFETGNRLDEAIAAKLAGGNMSIFEQIGAASARQNLTSVHQLLVRPGDPQGFMANTPTVYRLYYDKGRRDYQSSGPTSGVMTTYDAETYSSSDCATVIGWFKEALSMCGAKDVVINEPICRAKGGEFCRYTINWR
jgi:uncharacterized protein (TIGR02265 family)